MKASFIFSIETESVLIHTKQDHYRLRSVLLVIKPSSYTVQHMFAFAQYLYISQAGTFKISATHLTGE